MLKLYKEQPAEPESTCPTEPLEAGRIHFDLHGNQIYFVSLGCPRNLVDSEVMLGILLKSGYTIAPELEEADYLVINTCGFLEASRKESSNAIHEVAQRKKKNAKLIVTGCMVQISKKQCKNNFQLLTIF